MPDTSTTADGLAVAWRNRAERAARDLHYAQSAPALFKPEWTERAQAELTEADYWERYWRTVGGAR